MHPAPEEKSPRPGERAFPDNLALLACITLFLAHIFPWLYSEFWYDEIITLTDFAFGGSQGNSLGHVFRSYPVANNHILFSAISWVWLRLLQFNTAEYLLRLPSVVFAVLTIVFIGRYWRKWLGNRLAFYAGLLFAASPVFAAFAYQFRGYSLTMLLAVFAVTGAWEVARQNRIRGLWLGLPACLLLPLVMPSNLLLPEVLALFLAGRGLIRQQHRHSFLFEGIAFGAAGALGACYYLSIWEQFHKVIKQTAGWENAWLAGGSVLLAFAVHTTPALFAWVSSRKRQRSKVEKETQTNCLWLLLCCLLACTTALLIGKRAPFPRVFLVFLPLVSLAVLQASRGAAFWHHKTLIVAGLILANGFVWERWANYLTSRQIAEARQPQQLMQQYYRGENSLSTLAMELGRQLPKTNDLCIMTNAIDFPTFRFYASQYQIPHELVVAETRNGSELAELGKKGILLVVARNENEAAHLFSLFGHSGQFDLVMQRGTRQVYSLPGAASPLRRKRMEKSSETSGVPGQI